MGPFSSSHRLTVTKNSIKVACKRQPKWLPLDDKVPFADWTGVVQVRGKEIQSAVSSLSKTQETRKLKSERHRPLRESSLSLDDGEHFHLSRRSAACVSSSSVVSLSDAKKQMVLFPQSIGRPDGRGRAVERAADARTRDHVLRR